MRARTDTPATTPIFLTVDDDIGEEVLEPSRSVDALDRVMLGVEVDEFEPYTYEVIFPLNDDDDDERFAHFTETEETRAWN